MNYHEIMAVVLFDLDWDSHLKLRQGYPVRRGFLPNLHNSNLDASVLRVGSVNLLTHMIFRIFQQDIYNVFLFRLQFFGVSSILHYFIHIPVFDSELLAPAPKAGLTLPLKNLSIHPHLAYYYLPLFLLLSFDFLALGIYLGVQLKAFLFGVA